MDYDEIDIPAISGCRGIMQGCRGYCRCCQGRKRDAKREGRRRVRHAVKQSLRTNDDRQVHRTKPATRWDIN